MRQKTRLLFAAGLLIQVLLFTGKYMVTSAGELGGFQVQVGTGENTELPSGWDEEPAAAEAPEELPSQSSGGGSASEGTISQSPGNESASEGTISQSPGGGSVSEGILSEVSGNGEAAEVTSGGSEAGLEGLFWSGEESWEGAPDEETILPEQQNPAENLQNISPVPTPVPIPSAAPTPLVSAEQPSAAPLETPEPSVSEKKREAGLEAPLEQMPELCYWKGLIPPGMCLKADGEGELRVLSFKINGKEVPWSRLDHRIVWQKSQEADGGAKELWAELVILTYGDGVRGISIDEELES